MLGVESMPYCCAVKSIANEMGATHLAVECVMLILARLVLVRLEFVNLGSLSWIEVLQMLFCKAEL